MLAVSLAFTILLAIAYYITIEVDTYFYFMRSFGFLHKIKMC